MHALKGTHQTSEHIRAKVASRIRDRPAIQRFIEKFTVLPNGCWRWDGAQTSLGYGGFSIGVKMIQAYRWAYEYWVGPISEDEELDHLCRYPSCVNPDHTEAVSHVENTCRGRNAQREKTHCPQGHPYDTENTKMSWAKGQPRRHCKTCLKGHFVRYAQQRRELTQAKLVGV